MNNHSFDVTVPRYSDELVNAKPVTFFVIELLVNGMEWELKKRFNDFLDLYKKLKTSHGNLPPAPKKTLFKIKKPEDKEKRRGGLETFLKQIIEREDIRANLHFIDFIEVYFRSLIDIAGEERPRVHS